MSRSCAVAAITLTALGLLACERGHYETRDHAVPRESTGGEGPADGNGPGEADRGSGADATTDSTADVASAERGAGETGAGEAGETGAGGGVATAGSAADERVGHAPEEGMQRARVEAGPVVQTTVHSATGPITLWFARRAIGLQSGRIDHCYRVLLAADAEAAGSIRAVLTVEATGSVAAELETTVPELDRTVPCIDAALEATRLPAATDGRPSHIILEVSLAPRR